MSCRIICVGNRTAPGDDTGPRVFDRLAGRPLPAGVRLTDGGLAGLDLLGLFDGERRVVVVDAVDGFAGPGEIAVVPRRDAVAGSQPRYGHADGLAYLLAVLPEVCDAPLPEVTLVGAAGPADDGLIDAIAATALAVATGNHAETGHG